MNEELETAISIITTSYLRTEDLIRSVRENLPYINEPVRANFEAFVYEAELINANTTSAINSLKMKIPNRVFHEWANILIQCQSDRSMKNTLLPSPRNSLMYVCAVGTGGDDAGASQGSNYHDVPCHCQYTTPLFFKQRLVSYTAVYTPGKIALAICAAIILFALTQIMKLSKPIEYGGDGV